MKRYIKASQPVNFDVYMLMYYHMDSGENGPQGDIFQCRCKFFASSLNDAKLQLEKAEREYPDIFDDEGYYVTRYNEYFDYGDEVYNTLDAYIQNLNTHYDEYYDDVLPF